MKTATNSIFNELLSQAMAYIENGRTDPDGNLKAAFDTLTDFMTPTEIESAFSAMAGLKELKKIPLSDLKAAFINADPLSLVGRNLFYHDRHMKILVVDVKSDTVTYQGISVRDCILEGRMNRAA